MTNLSTKTLEGLTSKTINAEPVHLDGLLTSNALINNLMQKKFDELGGQNFFGTLIKKDTDCWYYKGGCLFYNDKVKSVYEIHGEIYKKWTMLGGLVWGKPCTNETATPDTIGRYNHFNDNQASIYWTPQTGANCIYGAIRERWSGLGWERSYLGYPTSDEVNFSEGGRANSFQHGDIYWWGDTGAIDLKDVILHYTGLYCFGETDRDQSSNSDEPYFIISISTPTITSTTRTQIYSDVDAKEVRPDLMEIYRGKPYGINIAAVLMENDFGDPNKYKDEIQKAVMAVHEAGTIALGLIPLVGPILAAIAGPTLGSLMPKIGGAINDLFNWGDDRIGGCNITLSAKQMVLLATRTNNSTFHGIGYKVESSLISGSGASYKAYFGTVPA